MPKEKKSEMYAAEQYKGNSMLCVHGNTFDIPAFSLPNLFYQDISTDRGIKEGKDPKVTFVSYIHRNTA